MQGGHMQSSFSPLLPAWLEYSLSSGRITGQPGLKHGGPAVLLPPEASTSSSSSSRGGGSSGGRSDPEASAVLAAIRRHREHLLANRKTDDGPLDHLARSLSMRPTLKAEGAASGSGSSSSSTAGTRPAQEAAGANASSSSGVGWGEVYRDVRLWPADGYMPPASVLGRSEFLLPLDDAAREIYTRALQP